ncbi:MAG TPA: hypothetical protein VFS60_06410 [Thermoanaerobaculia bacterium]|nr:hypothetical protein [Thermoanaerobaculia bacterium]
MRTFAYDDSRASLFHPERATDFFEHGEIRTDDALCAEMARLAYVHDEAALRQFLARARFELIAPIDVSGSQAFVADDGAVRVVAFRGSQPDDPSDIFADANFRLVPWESGGRVNDGFRAALEVIWSAIEPHLATPHRLLYTGHSLGAALATLAASRLPPAAIFTIGSPLVGDVDFGRTLAGVKHHRYVDCCDLVTRVPPSELFDYRHTGERRFLDRQGTLRPAFDDDDIQRERRAARTKYFFEHALLIGTVPTRDLADHSPINYVSALLGLD